VSHFYHCIFGLKGQLHCRPTQVFPHSSSVSFNGQGTICQEQSCGHLTLIIRALSTGKITNNKHLWSSSWIQFTNLKDFRAQLLPPTPNIANTLYSSTPQLRSNCRFFNMAMSWRATAYQLLDNWWWWIQFTKSPPL
jgi:hypothetical protein